MTQHTPGPWQLDSRKECLYIYGFYRERMHFIAMAYEDKPNAEANARLIAAAPELLEALKAAEPVIDLSLAYYGSDEAIAALKSIRAAIAKAEGRT